MGHLHSTPAYHLVFEPLITGALDQGGDYVIRHVGRICSPRDETIGFLHGFFIDGGRALDEGVGIVAECDDATPRQYAKALYDGRGDFRQRIQDLFEGPPNHGLLVIDRIMMSPTHRGQGLGLLAARKYMDLYGAGAGLVACQPRPLQFESSQKDPTAFHSEKSEPKAKEALARYISQLGMNPVPRTPYWALSTAMITPRLNDLCQQIAGRQKPQPPQEPRPLAKLLRLRTDAPDST